MTTTDPHATCINRTDGHTCGHPQDEHSRLSGCLHFVGAHACPCPEFTPGQDLPVTPYDGGTSSGYSGTTTSHARALQEDADGTTKGRQEQTLSIATMKVDHGLTVKELREWANWHHGQASSALSNLHQAGRLVRLTETRDRCKVYVLPDYAGDRPTEPHGERQSKPRTPKSRGPVTLTPTEADALAAMRTRLASPEASVHSLGVRFTDQLAAVCGALEARSREPKA